MCGDSVFCVKDEKLLFYKRNVRRDSLVCRFFPSFVHVRRLYCFSAIFCIGKFHLVVLLETVNFFCCNASFRGVKFGLKFCRLKKVIALRGI